LTANDTVDGKLVPCLIVATSGFCSIAATFCNVWISRPPATWDELETMAARIQKVNEPRVIKAFGALCGKGRCECLTCNALEWQASKRRADHRADKTISVNNPQTIRRGKGGALVGSISPPSVVAYKEWDGRMLGGRQCAFMRNWPQASVQSRAAGRQSGIIQCKSSSSG